MTRRRLEKTAALVLSLMLVFTMIPSCIAFADETEEPAAEEIEKPGTTSITSTIVGKKTAVIKWKKDAECSGYILSVAENSGFTKELTEYTIKGAENTSYKVLSLSKSKRYYVKVREYCMNGTQVVYGDDSKVISVKYLTAWKNVHVIKHACGIIDDTVYSNSLEALKRSISNGSKAIEIDFGITSDGVLVCTHGFSNFDKVPTLSEFMKKKYAGKYTPMTAETALTLLAKRFNVYLVVDCRENTVEVYRLLNSILIDKGYASYRINVVPQIYGGGEYGKIKKMYGFKNWIFTMYKLKGKLPLSTYKTVASYCKKKKIGTVTMYKDRVNKKRTAVVKKAGLMLGIHTVKTKKAYLKFRKAGGQYIYCDM